MEFTVHAGSVAPLDQANVDTDQIIPKQFLTAVSREGFGRHLFHDWRYLDRHEQQPNPQFVLNQPRYANASILLTRENFGCGSSREHAPWALADFGFRVIVAPSFADIFYANCINNQLLPVVLQEAQIDQLFAKTQHAPDTLMQVNLQAQSVQWDELVFPFDIAPHHKTSLIKGLDAIGLTLEKEAAISDYENTLPGWLR